VAADVARRETAAKVTIPAAVAAVQEIAGAAHVAPTAPAMPKPVPPVLSVPTEASIDGAPVTKADVDDNNWWSRLWGAKPYNSGRNIHIELRKADTSVVVDWPVEGSKDCAAWLSDVFKQVSFR
jgi:hypothetical protein